MLSNQEFPILQAPGGGNALTPSKLKIDFGGLELGGGEIGPTILTANGVFADPTLSLVRSGDDLTLDLSNVFSSNDLLITASRIQDQVGEGLKLAYDPALLNSTPVGSSYSAVGGVVSIQAIDDFFGFCDGSPDIDGNGAVEFSDFLVFSATFGQSGVSLPADIDCSGTVDFTDFLLISNSFGQSVATSSVPEPNATALAFSFFVLASLGRRTRSGERLSKTL